MSRAIRKTSAVLSDIVEQALFVGQDNPDVGLRFIESVEHSLSFLAKMPELGGTYDTDNHRLKGLRVWRVRGFEKHLIFYRADADGIEIIRILHGARDILAILGDDVSR